LFLAYANIPIFCAAEKDGGGVAAATGAAGTVGVEAGPELPESDFLQLALSRSRNKRPDI